MERLIEGKGDNSPETYNKIFQERQERGLDWQDVRRWKKMLKYFKGGEILDVGCLDSLILEFANEDKYPMLGVGIDVAEKAIEKMQKRYPQFIYLTQSIFDRISDGGREYFNYICMGEILEHLEKPHLAVWSAMELLKPGGWLVISVPLNEAIEPGAVDKDRHLWSFTSKDMMEMLKMYGKVKFKVLRSRYFPKYRYCFKQLIVYCKKYEQRNKI